MKVFKSVIVRLGVVGTAATAVVALAAGTAAAYWLTTGSGTATAQAGTAQNPTTTAVAVTSGLLLPRGTGDVFIRGNNRSEERRVGKEGRSRGAPDHLKKKK